MKKRAKPNKKAQFCFPDTLKSRLKVNVQQDIFAIAKNFNNLIR